MVFTGFNNRIISNQNHRIWIFEFSPLKYFGVSTYQKNCLSALAQNKDNKDMTSENTKTPIGENKKKMIGLCELS